MTTKELKRRTARELIPPCGHTEGKYHDCATVMARNRLIPSAEQAANLMVAREHGVAVSPATNWTPTLSRTWTRAFHEAMARLAGG